MAQPSQIGNHTRVVSGRVSAAQFVSLNQELADRRISRSDLVAELVLGWLRAVTGRGYHCTCPDCPGNLRQNRRLADTIQNPLFEDMTA